MLDNVLARLMKTTFRCTLNYGIWGIKFVDMPSTYEDRESLWRTKKNEMHIHL